MKSILLSIVIPAYNEETNIRLGALDKVARYLEKQAYPWEVLVVDDGSNDGTPRLIEDFIENNGRFRLIRSPHRGKAAAIMTGAGESKGTIVLFSDLDQATPLKEVEKLLPWFDRDFDVVIGSRKGKREGAPVLRRFMAFGFTTLRTVILGLPGVSDTQCGFKAFKRGVADKIFHHLSLYSRQQTVSGAMVTAGFDIEVLFVAKLLGYQIKEVPVEWHYVETRRVNPITDSWQGLMDIAKIRINEWKGVYTPKENT